MSIFSGENQEVSKVSSVKDSLYRFIEPETLKPLRLLMIMIFFINLLSGIPYTPYLIAVFDTFKVSFNPVWATVSQTIFNSCPLLYDVLNNSCLLSIYTNNYLLPVFTASK